MLAPDDIRIRGTRIGIESILYEYFHRAQTPEDIASRFHTVTLEQVYATIVYYLHNRDVVNLYLADWQRCRRSGGCFREWRDRSVFAHLPPIVPRQTSKDFPFLAADTSFAKDLPEQLWTNVARVWVRNMDVERALAHELMAGSGKWPLEAKLMEKPYQITPADRPKSRH